MCALTGEPTPRTYRRVVHLRRWWIWLGLLVGLLLVLVLQHLCCDPLTVRVPVSRRVARQRMLLGWLAGALLLPLGFVLGLWAAVEPGPVSIAAGVLGLAALAVPLVLRARTTVKLVRDEDVIRFVGAHAGFVAAVQAHLDSLRRPAAGWHPCPSGAPQYRWWDGARWTEHVAGVPA